MPVRRVLRSGALARPWAPALVATGVTGLLLVLAFSNGGYFPESYLGAGAIAWVLLAVVLAIRPPSFLLSIETLIAVAALAGLAVWMGLSTRWSLAPDAGLQDTQRTLCYLGILGLGIAGAGSGRYCRRVVWLMWLVLLVVAAAGLGSRLLPDVLPSAPDPAVYRLSWPLGYWNAFGAACAMGAVLGLGLAADLRQRIQLRGLAATGSVLQLAALYLSLSRGAWLALIVGVVMLVVMGAHRGALLLSLAVVGTAAAIIAVRLGAYEALTSDPALAPGQLPAGHAVAPTIVLLALAAGALQSLLAVGRVWPELDRAVRRVMRPLVLVVIALALAGSAGIYLVRTTAVERHSESGLHKATTWLDKQWRDFMRPGTFAAQGSQRLTSAKGTRSELYRVGLDEFIDHPIAGDGAGSYAPRYIQRRRVDETVKNAHSLEIETLAELGIVGAALLALLIGAIGFATARARLTPGALGRSQVAAVGAALSVWAFHSATDWDWQVPALTGTALVLGASVLPYGRRLRRGAGGEQRAVAQWPPATVPEASSRVPAGADSSDSAAPGSQRGLDRIIDTSRLND